MPDIYDYLNWRGDLSLKQAPLNHIDCLILSRISYLPFDGLVPKGFNDGVSISEANEALQAVGEAAHYIMKADKALLPAVAKAPRFGNMRLSGFVNHIDDALEKQFSALVADLGTGASFISYRGTDNTIVGWKEDFNMSFMSHVPSQLEAVSYLEAAAKSLHGPLVLGGHSKGGNLAAYAGVFCQPKVQERILNIYNFDGPGFHAEIMAEPGYAAVCKRLRAIVPQSSIVGLLLEHEENVSIIHSTQSGFMQHDLYSWELMRDNFVYLEDFSSSSRFVDKTLRAWLAEMSIEQRSAFIDGLYSIVKSSNVKKLKDLTGKNWPEHAFNGVKALINLDEHTRMVLGRTLVTLVKAGKENLHIFLPGFLNKNKEKKMLEAGKEDK